MASVEVEEGRDVILYGVDSVEYMSVMGDKSVDFVLADPPYAKPSLINASVKEALRVSKYGAAYFMYGEDLAHLDIPPDRVCYWVKPISTKNTSKNYSRFVEVIALYNFTFHQAKGLHWANRSGIFTDVLIGEGNLHPFAKPESLIERLIWNHVPLGGLVLDPFAGSGTVKRVCDRLGFQNISLELAEKEGDWII